MSAASAVAFFGLEVPAGDEPTAVLSDIPGVSNIRITMAAIDPTAKPVVDSDPKRATLKILRRPLNVDDYMDSEDDSEDDEENEEANTKKNKKLAKKEAGAAIKKSLKEAAENAKMEVDAKEDAEGDKGESEDDDEDEDDEDDDFQIEEFTVCTLDSNKHYQQPLDIVINEEEEVFFKVVGNYDISLTGNYVVLPDPSNQDGDYEGSDDDSDYDLSPDEGELMYSNGIDSDASDDELDDVPDPRITEVDTDEEEKEAKKGKADKNLKRPLEESPKVEAEKKLSKRQLKKLKANDGKAVNASQELPDKKKVQFAKELEQGASEKKKDTKPEKATKPEKSSKLEKDTKPEKGAKPEKDTKSEKADKSYSVKVVQGVKVEDRKIGDGPTAKNGAKLGMRYIGKLENGKVFDSNTKGKPFVFKLGKGEVIKGWDIGIAGMKVGGERRITIPSDKAYGKEGMPGIPSNSTLIFDIKLLEVKNK